MASPSKPPATPNRPPRNVTSTPASGARTQCSADPADFDMVKIHTAKCSICDKRNATDEMRRCKGCTWQICRPCQVERKAQDRSLAHGNLMSATPTSTVRRRVLHKMGTTPSGKAQDPEAAKSSPVTGKQPEEKKPAAPNKDSAQGVTPPSSSERRKLQRRARTKTSMAESSGSDNDEYTPDPQSPLGVADRKRRLAHKDTVPGLLPSPQPFKRRRLETPAQATPPETTHTMSPEEDPLRKTYTSIDDLPGIRPSEHQDLIKEYYGASLPSYLPRDGKYLHRNVPRPENDHVLISPLIARGSKPRKTGEQFMEEVRDKDAASAAEQAAPAEPTPQEPVLLLREFVNRQVHKLHPTTHLDEDQQVTLASAMRDTARKFGLKLLQQMPPAFKPKVANTLDLSLDYFNDAQKEELVQLVQAEAARKLQEYADEADMFASTATPRPEHADAVQESSELSTV